LAAGDNRTLECDSDPVTVVAGDFGANGQIVNTATVAGDAVRPGHAAPTSTVQATSNTTIVSEAKLAIDKSIMGSRDVTHAGQVVTYRFVVTNEGAVTLTNVSIVDPGTFTSDPSVTNPIGSFNCPGVTYPVATLAVGVSFTCYATYHVTQADMDAGTVTNEATATGSFATGDPASPTGAVSSVPSRISFDTSQHYRLALSQTADPTWVEVPDTVQFTYTLVNRGNVDLSGITLDETSFDGNGTWVSGDITDQVTCTTGAANDPFDLTTDTLAPHQVVTCLVNLPYTTVAADATGNPGTITSTGQAHATDQSVDSNHASASVDVYPQFIPDVHIRISKTADKWVVTEQDNVVTYTFSIFYYGNMDLSGVMVTDPMFNNGQAFYCDGDGTLSASPTSSTVPQLTCTKTLTVTDFSVFHADPYRIDNRATLSVANAVRPNHTTPTMAVASVQSRVVSVYGSQMSLEKTVDASNVHKAGDTATYTFTLTNETNIWIDSISIVDGFAAGDLTNWSCSGPSNDPNNLFLGPITTTSGVVTCTADYVVTQDDVDAGFVNNTAHLEGRYVVPDAYTSAPGQDVISTDAQANFDIQQVATVSLTESVDKPTVEVPGTLTFAYTLTNTGNIDLSGFTLTEDSFDGNNLMTPSLLDGMECVTGDPEQAFDLANDVLAPDQSVICRAQPYTTVAADAKQKKVTSTGSVISLNRQGLGATASAFALVTQHIANTGGTPVSSGAPVGMALGLAGLIAAVVYFVRRRFLLG